MNGDDVTPPLRLRCEVCLRPVFAGDPWGRCYDCGRQTCADLCLAVCETCMREFCIDCLNEGLTCGCGEASE